jgi:hypothetical protein
MSGSSAGPSHNTVLVRAALVFPGDPAPNMGHDVARIPVRVVWREADAPANPTIGSGSAGAAGLPDTQAMPGDGRGGDDAPPAVPAASEPERPPAAGFPGTDPIAKFLEVNEALNRISGGGDMGMTRAAVPAIDIANGNARATSATTSHIWLAAASNPEEEAASISEGGSLNPSA